MAKPSSPATPPANCTRGSCREGGWRVANGEWGMANGGWGMGDSTARLPATTTRDKLALPSVCCVGRMGRMCHIGHIRRISHIRRTSHMVPVHPVTSTFRCVFVRQIHSCNEPRPRPGLCTWLSARLRWSTVSSHNQGVLPTTRRWWKMLKHNQGCAGDPRYQPGSVNVPCKTVHSQQWLNFPNPSLGYPVCVLASVSGNSQDRAFDVPHR